ncbi:conserved unknown protein [Ectocarpus siliculosus]|uniref:CLU central domain-containing protein n=1 Tax=Ectocarpus siliculosus TaxID=2880 RepID=D8LF63_ECTSI|nr:conserved unknown protein [Ectocarpus siliculosus]|eukprot:CBN78661.1 conserved unknown protein [Ectocarpus siliculosus]
MVPLDRHNLARKNIKYQVLLDSTREVIEVFGDKISDRYQSVFWRMLRPEFVKGDSETMAVVGAHVGAAAVPTAAAAEARQELDSPAPAAARTLPIGFPSRISERPEEESGASSGATSGSSTGAALPMTAAFRPLASRGPQDGQGPAPDAAADTGGRAFGPVEHGDEAPPPLNPLSGHYEQGFLDDSERGVDVSGNGDEHAAPTGWNAPSIPGSGGEAVDNASPPSGSPAPTAAAAASPSVTFRRKVPQTPPVRGTPGRRTHGGGGRRGDATPPGRGMPGGGREGGRDPATDGYDANVETLTLTESGGSCEAFIDFDENNQYERGLPTGSLRAGSSNNWSFSSRRSRRIGLVGVQSYHFSSSYFGRAGSAPVRVWHEDREAVYPDNHGQGQTGQSILFGGGGTGSEGNVGGGAGRGVVLEDMTRGRANVSYRFYPDPEPEPDDGDQQIHDATSVMLEVAVPNVVEKLTSLPQDVQKTLHLDVELHRHGVNVRHLGKVRFLLMEQNKPENGLLKDMMLTEMIARTLKNILRCFQRTWMKAEKSTSEQGMRMLVVRFLNLVTGAHINSATFWKEKVLTGVLQRFGLVSLTTSERRDVQKISRDPYVLQDCVFKLTEMQGVVLTEDTKAHFYADSPVGFEFTVSDIREINPIVRYMHILDYGGGVMLSMQAQRLMAEGKGNTRTVERLHGMANQFFITAYRSLPDDPNTRAAILSYSKSAGFSLFSSAPGDQPAHFSSGAGGVDAGESESDSGAAQSSETGTRSGLVIRSLTKMTSAFRERNNNDNDELGPPPGHSPGYFHFAGPERSRIPAPAPGMSQDRWSTRRREQPQQPAPTTTKGREDVLMTSLGPGPATYVSKRHSIEFELQAGSLDEELALEMTITRSLAFVDCRTEGSARLGHIFPLTSLHGSRTNPSRAPFYDDASTEEFLAMNFVHGPEGVTFPEDKPAKLRFFLGYVDESTPAGEGLDQVAVSDEEIERDILKTYRPLTSPDGVGDWTTLGPYSVICRRQLGEREVWVETPVNHLRVFSNAMKTDKGGKNQSYYYGDMGGLRWWFKGRSSVPKVRFGNTTKEHCATFTCYPIVQHTAVSGESEGNGGIGAGGISLWGGRRDQHSAAGGATPAAFEKITNIVDVGTYEDCDLLCDLKQHLQMNVRVGILSNLEGVEVELTGRLQLLDSKKISGNKILVLRQLRLSRPSQFRKIDWPCDPEAICKI